MSCTKPAITRALDVFKTVLAEIESRGWRWDLEDKRGRVGVLLQDQRVPISIEEKMQRVDNPDPGEWGPKYAWESTGQLRLVVRVDYGTCRKRWGDTDRQRVEDKVSSFVDGIEKAALATKAWVSARDAQLRRWAEERQAANLERELLEAEPERVEGLFAEVQAWRKAEDLRAYVAANGRKDTWSAWALAVADDLDPLQRHDGVAD